MYIFAGALEISILPTKNVLPRLRAEPSPLRPRRFHLYYTHILIIEQCFENANVDPVTLRKKLAIFVQKEHRSTSHSFIHDNLHAVHFEIAAAKYF